MTNRRTLTHRHGSLFDETNIALWLAAMDARAAVAAPSLRRLSITELPASPSGRDPRPGEDRARTEASAVAGKQVGGRLVRDSHGRLTPPYPARSQGERSSAANERSVGTWEISTSLEPRTPEAVSPSRVVPAVIAVAAADASTTYPRLTRDRKGTESAGALQRPSQRMRSQPGLPPHSGTPSSAAMGARAQAARGG